MERNQQENSRFRLDLTGYQLLDADRPVRLEKQPMELLILLAERKGELVGREEIAARLWGKDVFVDTERNINSIVRKLRQALKDDSEDPKFLETVVGKGYRFVGPLEIISKSNKEEAQEDSEQRPETHMLSRNGPLGTQRSRYFAGIAIAILLIGALYWLGWRKMRVGTVAAAPIRSIAVLPLDNVSGDAQQEYFADGMTQELTSELAQIGQLRVISHTSVLQYEGSRKPLPEIANELHVDAVIEGSVLRSGNRVRVTAQLVRAPMDQTIWASNYERDLSDVLSLQRNIAQDVAEQVKGKLVNLDEAAARGGQASIDPAVHDAYLHGLFHSDKNTEKDLVAAIDYFQQAIARKPDYAPAYAGLADSYVELGIFYWPPPLAMPKAKAAALKALELDSSISEAHNSLGNVYYFYGWDWAGAEREAKTAIALNPNNAYAHDLLGGIYATSGEFKEGLKEIQRARELAPRAAVILGDTVFWAFFSRDYDLAIANGKAAVAAQSDNAFAQAFLGMAYAKKGQLSDALKHADLAQKYDGGPLIASFRANVYALAGRRTEAKTALREVEKQRVENYSCSYEIGTAYVLLGQRDTGFRWLDDAYNSRSECMILLKVDPRLDSIRSDSRYMALLRRVGLSD